MNNPKLSSISWKIKVIYGYIIQITSEIKMVSIVLNLYEI